MPTTLPTNNCDPRLITVDAANGSTLTRASIRAFTRQDFEDQALKEVGFDKIIAQTKEARLCGVREKGLTDLLLSRHVALKMGAGTPTGSVIAPYRLVPRRNIVNANYFWIEAGTGTGAGTGNIPAHAWKVTVNVGNSDWVQSPNNALKNLEKYFLVGGQVLVEYKDGSGVSRSANFTIHSANETSGSNGTKADVWLVPPYSTAAVFAALSASVKAVYQPTVGLVSLLANSISDYESYNAQLPAVNNMTLKEVWRQTHRWQFAYNEEYVKALEAEYTSEFFKKFRSLPIAEQRRQVEAWVEKQMYNTFFYGDAISEKQTVENYQGLPLVTDPDDSGYSIEYKSNALGIRTQLGRCGQINDRQGAALNIDTIMEACYKMKRYREATGGSVDVIDSMTGRFNKGRIRDIMIRYYKQKYASELTMYAQLGQKLEFNGATVFEYDLYDLPDQGVQWAVFTDTYFDDKLAQFNTAQKSRGNSLWFIDWSDVAINVIRTNSAKRMTDVKNPAYFNIIQPNMKHVMLNSKTFEVDVGDTNRHLLIENFSDAAPSVTVNGVAVAM